MNFDEFRYVIYAYSRSHYDWINISLLSIHVHKSFYVAWLGEYHYYIKDEVEF